MTSHPDEAGAESTDRPEQDEQPAQDGGGAGVEITSDGDGTTFEPEEDPEAAADGPG